jgi:hypothetical protein
MQKTGTSALQLFFHVNRRKLKSDGIIYPRQRDIGVSLSAISFQNCIATTLGDFKPAFPPAPESSIRALRRRMLRSSGDFLLSGESFSRIWNLNPLREAFADVDVKVIVYLREQADWAQSLYNQRNKLLFVRRDKKLFEGDIPSEKDFFRFMRAQKYERLLRYDELIMRWLKAFGRDNMVVRVFPPENGLAEGFLDVLGIDDVSKYKLPPRVNESLSNEWITLIRETARESGVEAARAQAEKLAADARAGRITLNGSTKFLPKPVSDRIREEHEEGNAWIAREFLGRDTLFE